MKNTIMSAVEWLEKKLIESGVNLLSEEVEFIKQANEIEKQQKIDFANNYGFDICGYDYNRAEQYYNETYKKD